MSGPRPMTQHPRRRGALLPTLVIATVLVLLFVLFTNIWTDMLWFRSMDFTKVFTTMFWTRVGLFLGFGALMAGAVVGSTALAYRLRPVTRRGPLSSELLERYREVLESRFVQVMVALGILVGLFGGAAAAGNSMLFLAWRNSERFGVRDPRFGLDLGFFVFDFPWWRFVIGFAIAMFVFAAATAAVVHYVMGALRVGKDARGQTSPAAQAQLSVLIGLAVLAWGVTAWFDRYGYEITSNSLLTGIGYTDDHARVTASLILAVIAALCAALFFANAVLRRWIVPVAAMVLMLVSGVILGMIYPAAVQGLSVRPNEPDKERPYIQRHIDATRAAYGVDKVEVTDYSAETKATAGQLRADAEALPGIRLIDPAVVSPTFEQLQQVRGFYQFPRILDVDRYNLENRETDTVVAVRELDQDGLADKSWNNVRTVYTHGYGMVAAYGNRRNTAGEPEWIVRDMPPTGQLSEHEPRVYFGEQHTAYSIVGAPAGARPIELDTPGGGDGGDPKLNTYTGKGGVPIGNWFNRILYSIRFADVTILLSGRVNDASKIIYDRTPKERVEAAAPWLTVDSNAYPAVVEGRIVWIVDGYTTSDSYPNSHRVSLERSTSDSQSRQGTVGAQPDQTINYIRNSVKAVVDAYDGTVKLYAWDSGDPVLRTWEKAFPGTVTPRQEIPQDLMSHLRYPEDLFKVQREVLGRYHVTDPMAWFQQNDLWEVPNDPIPGNTGKETPYYLSVKWPGDNDAHFSQTAVYVPRNRSNLAAYMAVNADAASPEYGRLRILRMSDQKQIDGPGQTFNAMTTNTEVASRLRPFLNQGAAAVTYGNLLTLPVGGGLLYAQPVYTQRSGSTGSYPALTFVVVRFGEHVGIGDTLQQALDQVFSGDAGADTGEDKAPAAVPPGDQANANQPGQPPAGADTGAAATALRDADQAFADADKALRSGDLATYQKKNAEAKAATDRAKRALGG